MRQRPADLLGHLRSVAGGEKEPGPSVLHHLRHRADSRGDHRDTPREGFYRRPRMTFVELRRHDEKGCLPHQIHYLRRRLPAKAFDRFRASGRFPHHSFQRPHAGDLERKSVTELLPCLQHGGDALLRRQPAGKKSVLATAAARAGIRIEKIRLHVQLFRGISALDEFLPHELRQHDIGIDFVLPRADGTVQRDHRTDRRGRSAALLVAAVNDARPGEELVAAILADAPLTIERAHRAHQAIVSQRLHHRNALRPRRVIDGRAEQRKEVLDMQKVAALFAQQLANLPVALDGPRHA